MLIIPYNAILDGYINCPSIPWFLLQTVIDSSPIFTSIIPCQCHIRESRCHHTPTTNDIQYGSAIAIGMVPKEGNIIENWVIVIIVLTIISHSPPISS